MSQRRTNNTPWGLKPVEGYGPKTVAHYYVDKDFDDMFPVNAAKLPKQILGMYNEV